MLYATTRNNRETVTSYRAMTEDRADDGGFYVPFREPKFSEKEQMLLASMPLNQRIGEILNTLFQTKLSRWDIEFCIGRNSVKFVSLRHRIVMGEFWHNPDWDYQKTENTLAKLLIQDVALPGSWLRIGIRIAFVSAVCLELHEDGAEAVDISMVSGDLLWFVSAWYAREWGLPVGNLILCCNENKSLWELLCHGQLRTDAVAVSTELPEADVAIPAELERLIYACGNSEEVLRYLDCCRKGVSYYPESAVLTQLQKGNYVSVVSSSRIRDIVPGALGTHGYLLSPGSALAYGGLLDYRAKKGSLRPALVICERNPLCDTKKVSEILGIAEEDLQKYL